MSFYSDKQKALNLSGAEEANITDEMQEIIDTWIDTNIKWDGFGKSTTVTEYYDVDKITQSEVVLKHFPVISVDEVVDNAQSDIPKVISPSAFVLDGQSGIIQLRKSVCSCEDGTYSVDYFTKGKSSIKVTYSFGHESVPDVITKLATIMLAKWAKIKSIGETGVGSVKSVRIGDYSESYDLEFMGVSSEYDGLINSMIKRVKEYYADGV